MEEVKSDEEKKATGWAVRIEGPLAIIPALPMLGAILYAIYSRSIADFARFPLVSSFVIAALLIVMLLPSSTLAKNLSLSAVYNVLSNLAVIWIFSAFVSLVLYSIGISLMDSYYELILVLTPQGKFSIVVGIGTLLAGAMFFWLRTKWRVTYGVSEAFVGVAIASHRAYGEPNNWGADDFSFYAAVLTAGIYLVVRGLDNVNQGRHLHRDPLLRMWNWLKVKTFTTDPMELCALHGDMQVRNKLTDSNAKKIE